MGLVLKRVILIVYHSQIESIQLTGMVAEGNMPKSGVLTSPNFPEHYPFSHDSTQTIEVAEGKTISFTFTHFNTEPEFDYVQILDEDGTNLTPGSRSTLDPKLWGRLLMRDGPDRWSGADGPTSSNSNIIHVKFHTDGDTQRTGWRLEWHEQ